MTPQYSKKQIFKALLLTPLPLLFFTVLFFIIANREYSLYSILIVLVGHTAVYLAYCILTIPFSFTVSLFLSYSQALNLFTICICSFLIATPFFLFLDWGHTGKTPDQWGKIYSNPFSVSMILFPGICYWLFLIGVTDKERK
nr:hypothetical protein [Acinetobacter sp. Marseille-Q1620]